MKTELIDSCGRVIYTSEVDYYDFGKCFLKEFLVGYTNMN